MARLSQSDLTRLAGDEAGQFLRLVGLGVLLLRCWWHILGCLLRWHGGLRQRSWIILRYLLHRVVGQHSSRCMEVTMLPHLAKHGLILRQLLPQLNEIIFLFDNFRLLLGLLRLVDDALGLELRHLELLIVNLVGVARHADCR